jgi:beta-lactamase regulating signal transducer with metallopeptidase domain
MSADSLARGYSTFVTYLAEPALRSLAIGCVAAIALAVFRVQRVTTRLLTWTAVLCAALAMPLLGAFLPRLPLAVPAAPLVHSFQATLQRGPAPVLQHGAAASNAVVHSAATTVRSNAKLSSAMDTRGFSDVPKRTARIAVARNVAHDAAPNAAKFSPASAPISVSVNSVAANVPAASAPTAISANSLAAAAPVRRVVIPWAALVLGIYLLGVAMLSTRLLVGVWFSRRLERAAQNIDDREALRLLRFRSCVAGLASAPQLKESDMLAVPATVGVRRAVVLLPADWRTWTEEQLDAILAHEVSHVARRDALIQLLSLVHRAIFWFSPLGWWIDKQLTDLAEQASDEAALAGGADRTRYAETLLGFFAQLGAAPGRVWWQGVAMAKAAKAGKAGRAERRVDRILAWKGAMSMKRSFAVALIAIAAPIVFLAASVHPFIASAQDKPPAPPQNVVQPGGPVAPVLPKAPKAPGVVAPAMAPAPTPAVAPVTPAPMGTPPARAAAPAIVGPIAPAALTTPSARPALMPVPRALANPPIIPGPIANGLVASPALAGALLRIPSASPTAAPPAPIASYAGITPMAEPAPTAPSAEKQDQSGSVSNTIVNGTYTSGGGPRYVIMSGKSEEVTMSGSDEDLNHARELRRTISGDFIWFERDEKSYVITDPGFIAEARALFAPEDALSKQQDELSRQQDALSKQQDALSEKMDNVKVKVPDITPDLERIRAELDALRHNGGTQSELGRLQSELGELQSQVGKFQSDAGVQQSAIGRQQGELGRQQGEIGHRQGELGRQEGELARKASQQLREMFDEAIAKGIAKPE